VVITITARATVITTGSIPAAAMSAAKGVPATRNGKIRRAAAAGSS